MSNHVLNNQEELNSYIRKAILSRFNSLTEYCRWESKKSAKMLTVQRLCNGLSGDKPLPAHVLKRFCIKPYQKVWWEVEPPKK